MNKTKRIIIVGATSAIATECCKLWLKVMPVELILIARSPNKLKALKRDLSNSYPKSNIVTHHIDFFDERAIEHLVGDLMVTPVDIVLIAQGRLIENNASLTRISHSVRLNALSVILFSESFLRHIKKYNNTLLILIGSVAGDRGRKSNYIYGSAKAMIEHYAEGLNHRFATNKFRVLLVKPGPTATPMTAHLKANGVKLSPVNVVAKDIVKASRTNKSVIYSPKRWQLIMWIIKHLPRRIFNRLDI